MEGKITVSGGEFQRMRVFREVAEKRITLVVAAALAIRLDSLARNREILTLAGPPVRTG